VIVPSDHKGLRIHLALSKGIPGSDLCGKESYCVVHESIA
jgi:hypothetical protein